MAQWKAHAGTRFPVLDLKGKSLIQRNYRDDLPLTEVDRFLPLLLDMEEDNQMVTPCFTLQGTNFLHIRHNNLYRAVLRLCGHACLDCACGSPRSFQIQFQCCRDPLLPLQTGPGAFPRPKRRKLKTKRRS
jgi:hypothetical protein